MRDLYPHRAHSVSLCDALDSILNTGVVALGEVTISVADVDLLYLGLQLVITSIETGRDPAPAGDDWPNPGRVVRCGPQARLAQDTVECSRQTEPAGSSVPAMPAETESLAAPRMADHERQLAAPNPGGHDRQAAGLGKLVLTLIRLLHELLKRTAVRRMEAGSLSIAEMERLGTTLMRQAQEIERLAKDLGLEQKDLNLDLGPLGRLL
jgi:hypothetical protein